MKIIDLLVKIANGKEAPKIIKYRGIVFEYDDIDYFNTDLGYLFEKYAILEILNEEVKITEEKKIPEKLDWCEENTFMGQKETTYLSPKERRLLDSNFKELGNKINKIIDYLKSKGE